MLICTKCHIEYEEGKKFCKSCGSPLVAKEKPSLKVEEREQIKVEKPEGPLICPRCKVSYESGKYCRKCGSVLVEQVPSQEKEIVPPQPEVKIEPPQIQTPEKRPVEQPEGKLICPSCRIFYDGGKFCRKCGSTLVLQILSQEKEGLKIVPPQEVKSEEPEAQLFEKKYIKRLSKEWLKLSEEKKKLEDIMKKLETQRSMISSDVFNSTFGRYKDQSDSISSRYQQIETDLESVKVKLSKDIDLLVKELTPIKVKLKEIQSLYRAGALTKKDFSKESKDLAKQIRLRENTLKRYHKMLSLLPSKMGGTTGISGKKWNLFRPLPLAASGVIVLLVVVGYLLWPKYSYLIKKQPQTIEPISKEITTTPPTSILQAQPPSTAPSTEGQEVESIKYLLENIRQANLQKNIDLFMSCYALDFKDRDGRRITTLENWKNSDYLDLSYNMKSQAITMNTANVTVEWMIKIASKGGGQPEESKTVLNVELKKEEGSWKIKEIKPVS